jgi:hypothetical protein
MIFYATQAVLDLVSGTTWWLVSRTSTAIYNKIYPYRQVSEIELKTIDLHLLELTDQVKRQAEEIKELKSLLQHSNKVDSA